MKIYGLVAWLAWLCFCLARAEHGFDDSDLGAGHIELMRTITPQPRGGRTFAPAAVLPPSRIISPPEVSYSVTPTKVRTSSGTRRSLDIGSSRGHSPSSTRVPSQGHSTPSSRGKRRYSAPPIFSHIATGAPSQGHSAPPTFSHIATGAPSQGHSAPPTFSHIATGAPSQGHSAPSTYSHIGTGPPSQGHSAPPTFSHIATGAPSQGHSAPPTFSHIGTGAPSQGHSAPSSYSHIGTGAPSQGHSAPPTFSHIGTGAQFQGHSAPPTFSHIGTGAPSQGHSAPSTYSHIGTGAPSQGHPAPSTFSHIGTGAPSQGHSAPSTFSHIGTGAPSQGHSAPSTFSYIGTGAPSQGHSAPSSMALGHPQSSVGSFQEGVFTQIYGPPKQNTIPTSKPRSRPVTQYVPPTYVPPIYVPRTPTYAPPSSGYLPPSNVRSSSPSKSHSTLKVSRDSSSKEGPSAEVYFNLGDAFNYDVPPPSGASSSSGLQKTHRTIPKAVVNTRRPKTTYQTPKRAPSPGKPSSSKEDNSNYSYNYSVQGDTLVDSHGGKKEGPNFGHSEKRSGHRTEGRYFVKLPDGRTQIVEYYADETGYHPTITYA